MTYRFGPFSSNELDRLAREQLERERLEQLMQPGNVLFGGTAPGPGSTSPWEQTSPHMPGLRNGEPIVRPMPMPYHPQHPGSPVDPEYVLKPMPYRPGDPDAWIDPKDALMPKGLFDQGKFERADKASSADALGSMAAYTQDSHANRPAFPFRLENRKPDGTWDAPDATDENIKGTSVDPHEPRWPRWKQKPPLHGEGEFVSDEPFFDIDEIRQKVEFYPPGRPLTDKNVDDNPASRQRVRDMPSGNFFRRRLMVDRGALAAAAAPGQRGPSGQPAPSMQTQSGGSPLAVGDLTNFQVVSRNRGGGASNSQAYAHWLGGSGQPLDIEFSDANVESGLRTMIGESASGKTGPSSFQSAINQSLANNGAPVFVDTTAGIDTGGAVIGRVNTDLKGWITTDGGKWQFEGYVAGKNEKFDFNPDPTRSRLKDAATKALDALGRVAGAVGYDATYKGSIIVRASGNIRR